MKAPVSLDPKEYGISANTMLELVAPDTIALVLYRRTRIATTDRKAIIEKANRIRQAAIPGMRVALKTNAPIQEKTKKYLEAEGIAIL